MPIVTWRPFDILVDGAKRDRSGLRQLTVRLLDSPRGDTDALRMDLSLARSRKLTSLLDAVAGRDVDQVEVTELGEILGAVLLPAKIRQRLAASLDGLTADEGLRLTLRLDAAVADIPWEYSWVGWQPGTRDATGFLALHPRLSIVRRETGLGPLAADGGPRDRRVVALLANPTVPRLLPLDLDLERRNLEAALAAVPGIDLDVRPDATIRDLFEPLRDGADVLHFAGHGEEDTLYLVDAGDKPWPLPAEQLALNVRGRGVQLVVLGACESGTRDRSERWSGVATRLVDQGIPAVVAMQYRVNDGMAIAFMEAFYRSLAAGWTLDAAVGAGRLAMYNHATGGNGDPGLAVIWPDWGVPVLYAHPQAAVSLASVVDDAVREQVEEGLASTVRVRTAEVEQAARVIGQIGAGAVDVVIETEGVSGTVIGVDRGAGDTGAVDVDVTTGTVHAGGEVIGIRQGSAGRRRRRS